jgi:hypothetical protein
MSIFYYIKDTVLNLFNYFFKYKIKNNINNDINIQIEFFLKEIYENWKNKNINDIDITYDILNLFIKYQKNNLNIINTNIDKIEDKENNDMKYYTLGWYIYNCINNK